MELKFLTNEVIDCFAPVHESKSCDDLRFENDWINKGLVKCARCYLLNVKKWKFHNQNKYRFNLIIEALNETI